MPPIKCTYVQLEVSTDKVPCNHCKQLFTTWGLKSHEASCICRQEKTRRRKEFTNAADKVVEAQMKGRHKEKWHLCRVQAASVIAQEQQPAAVPHPTPFNLDTLSTLSMDLTANAAMSSISDTSMAGIPDGPDELTLHLSVSTPPSANIQPDSFKTEFHPKSGHPMMVDSFSTFDCSQGQTQNQPMVDDDSQPWHPFQTCEDFEFSEIAHQAALNKDHMNKLLSLIQQNQIAKGKVKFTLQSHHDITKAWKCMAKLMTPVPADSGNEVYKRSQKDGEALMQKQSLQPVKNAFWHINHSDPHHALSFDHLHYDDMGMGDHLFKETKKNLAEIGHHAEKAVDDHDGNKLTDIVKQLPFTAQSVLSPRKHPIGFALLWCIASYLSYHMYIILNIHTETTIATGECKLLAFQHHLEILQLDHRSLVSEFICSWLDHDDEECLKWMLDRHVLEDQENKLLDNNVFSGHIYLGSPQPPIMIANVEKTFTSCPFQSFHKKLTHFLNEFLPLCDIPIPGGHSWFVVPQEDKYCDISHIDIYNMSALAQLPGSFKLWKSYLQMRMSYMLGSPIHEERAGGGKKFPVLRDALEEHNYSEEWDSGLDGVISLEEWKSLIATYECTLTWLPKTLLLALKLPSYCCLWQGGLHVGSMSVLKGKVPTSYLGLLGHRLLFAEEVGLDVSDTVESNAMDARADAEAKVKELHLWMGNSYKKLLPMYNEDEDLLSKCKLNIEHIICKDGLRVYKDQAGCFWTDIATYWIIQALLQPSQPGTSHKYSKFTPNSMKMRMRRISKKWSAMWI
ncbi:hypothetical protein PISMIDRAFT_24608 [Pisolithus microcarpus 441]|uniref:Uncharacterized protein n=1 Tax=Pisolithus microcarpus 441 TaxID=765257 RepID=A0A0C9YXU2_9AGAM|nr:hypothetical protein PISMIDRAFT_24608 [Pisolithus microcarpus 441]